MITLRQIRIQNPGFFSKENLRFFGDQRHEVRGRVLAIHGTTPQGETRISYYYADECDNGRLRPVLRRGHRARFTRPVGQTFHSVYVDLHAGKLTGEVEDIRGNRID